MSAAVPMHDMLVRLYALPALAPALAAIAAHDVTIGRAIAPHAPALRAWVGEQFAGSLAEVEVALAHVPARVFVARRNGAIVGFACHDVTCCNFFGPEGVAAAERGKGIGRALLLSALHAMHAQGYAYAIVGGVGPAAFYARTVGAVSIDGSSPGIYATVATRHKGG